ncbi:MAG: phenylacetate--CoA ligase family protein [Chloroflexi bacterium]|nr:phenylacetate--CoA ligase family protein [Chloroflexota bacterium]
MLATALGRFEAVPVKFGPVTEPTAVIDAIRREAIDVIVGVPVHLLALVRREPALRLRSVLFATDHAPDPTRQALESRWGCSAFDHYGMTEMGLGGGVECEARRGYHLREADLLFEVVDPQTVEPLPDGTYGEIVFTTLTRRGMPLIRYRTGDWGRFLPGPCPCGTCLRTLERVAARVSGRLRIGNALLTIADLDRALFQDERVLNTAAALVLDGLRERLDLTVQRSDRSLDADGVHALLASVPGLSSLPAAITLVDHIPLTMAKRVLADRRESEHG